MSSNWWANKLGTAPVPQQQQTPQYAAPQPAQYAPSQQPQYPPAQQTQAPAPRCPGCGSSNYGGATAETRPRCYDCGYPLQQSGSGVGTGIQTGQQSGGPAVPSKQVATGGFNPTTIIGKL